MEDFLKMVESVIVWVTVYGSLIGALVLIFTRKPAPQSVEKETTDAVPNAVPTPKPQSGVAVPLILPCPVAKPDNRSRTTKDNEQDACFAEASHLGSDFDPVEINPASGLPMIDGIAGVDVAGNPYGTSDDSFSSSYFDNDSFSKSSFDNDW